MAEDSKVYCRDCKHNNSYSEDTCRYLKYSYTKDTPRKVKTIKVYARPDKDNKANVCIYYKFNWLDSIIGLVLYGAVFIVLILLLSLKF